jgi:hypothetical protein
VAETSFEDARKQLGKRGAAELLWRQKKLRFLLDNGRPEREPCQICAQKHVGQRGIYDAIKGRPGQVWFISFPRQRGKTYLLCALAIEAAIEAPNRTIHYAAATAKAVKRMIRPSFRKILKHCPEDMRPEWKSADGEYVFPNGSVIIIAGTDNENYENLRGMQSHRFFLDEAGKMDNLQVVLDEIALPMTQETDGDVIVATTPAASGDHYSVELMHDCQRNGTYFHQVLWDNPRMSYERIERNIAKFARGRDIEKFKKTAAFRREYMAEQVTDTDSAVIPEWYEFGAALTKEMPEPSHFDAYVSQDIGFRDGWGVLFGYWDFKRAALVIVDELLFFNKAKSFVSEAIIAKEADLWGEKKVYRRISDIDLITIQDQAIDHKLYFQAVKKDDKENMVNQLREWVGAGKVYIHPRCENLLRQLRNTVWNDRRDEFARSKDGHGDLLDALVYLVRSIDRDRNPFPVGPSPRADEHVLGHGRPAVSKEAAGLMMMMGKRRKFTA